MKLRAILRAILAILAVAVFSTIARSQCFMCVPTTPPATKGATCQTIGGYSYCRETLGTLGANPYIFCVNSGCCNAITCPEPNGCPDCQINGGGCTQQQVCTTCCPSGQVWDPATCTCRGTSPIVIDTTGKGFSLTSADDGVMFDFFADNKPFKASWTAAASGNAFLALPVDGKVENAKELFGNITPQPPSDHPNGFLALAVYDDPVNGGNGDGVIDTHDEVYAKLRLWIDANHNGVAEPEELHTLPELGVYSISLRYTDSPRVDEYGNKFRYKGLINVDPADGTSKDGRTTYDVFFVSAATAAASCKSSRKTQHISSASEQDKMDYPWMADTSLPDKLSKVMFADFGQTVKIIQSSLMETGPGNLDGTGAGVAFRLKFSDDHKAVLVLYPNDGKKGMKELFEQPVMETIVFESGRWEAKNAGVSGRIAQYGK